MPPRKIRSHPSWMQADLLPVTGLRDQSTGATYLPWTDPTLGLLGWEIIRPRLTRSVVIYMIPTVDRGVFEVRCHITDKEPDPENDHLLGTVTIPDAYLGDDEP